MAVISPALPNHGLPGLGQRLQPGDHLLGLERCRTPARSGGSARGRDRAGQARRRPRSRDISRSRACGRSAASATRGAGEQGRGADRLAAALGERVEPLRRGGHLARADVRDRSAASCSTCSAAACFAAGPASRASRRPRRGTGRAPAISQPPYFLAKSRSWSRRRFSSTSRRKVSLMSGGCAKTCLNRSNRESHAGRFLPHP